MWCSCSPEFHIVTKCLCISSSICCQWKKKIWPHRCSTSLSHKVVLLLHPCPPLWWPEPRSLARPADWRPVSTWKWYKSTLVQEILAISSVLRHRRITVPLTQTTATWDPVQNWNFPTDKNPLSVQKLWVNWEVSVIGPVNEPLLSSTCHVLGISSTLISPFLLKVF